MTNKTKNNGRDDVTRLAQRKQHGKVLKSPFSGLPGSGITWISWRNDRMPNIFWACSLAGNLDRTTYLDLFRRIAVRARHHFNDNKDASLCHNFLASTAPEIFLNIFEPLHASREAMQVISALTLIETLPDQKHWTKFAEAPSDQEAAWTFLARASAKCMFHQSQEATDVRWLKLMFACIIGRVKFPSAMANKIEELRLYPALGDMRSVRPFIRSGEMMLESDPVHGGQDSSIPQPACAKFWNELLRKTKCTIPDDDQDDTIPASNVATEIHSIIQSIFGHFHSSVSTSGVDARFDSSFGLILYALTLTEEIARHQIDRLASGRIVLRSIVELCITLHYLTSKDDQTIWTQYRNHGGGQTALAFLKNIDSTQLPDFYTLESLEEMANEDVWMESRDIELGVWANKNLRLMAQECGLKDLYDTYYDWGSGFSHGSWGAVRASVYTTCLNPLHRLHRIPLIKTMPSVLADCSRICNRMLDDLNSLYPKFNYRFKWHKKSA